MASFAFDIFYIVVIQVYSIVSVAANILCAYVFSMRDFKSSVFQYLTLNCLVECVFIVLMMPTAFINSRAVPFKSSSYSASLYTLIVLIYVARVVELTSDFINIKISIDRVLTIEKKTTSKKRTENRIKCKVSVFIMVLMAFASYTPKMFYVRIVNVNGSLFASNQTADNQEHFAIIFFEKSFFGWFFNFFSSYVTTFSVLLTRTILNSILVVKIIKIRNIKQSTFTHLTRVGSTRPQQAINRNHTTYLVLLTSAISMIEQINLLVLNFFFTVEKGKSIYDYRTLSFFLHLLFVFCYGSNILVYYRFNSQFADCLKRILNRP
jgi:hypothetical protein